MNLYYKVSRI